MVSPQQSLVLWMEQQMCETSLVGWKGPLVTPEQKLET